MKQESVIIVGAGWAGLAAAARLAGLGHRPLLLESARQPGGRARKVAFAGHAVDNGQHLFIGAYRSTLALLQQIGVPAESAFERRPLHLQIHNSRGTGLELCAPRLPAPLHLLWALLRARGLTFASRRQALKFGWLLWRNRLGGQTDQSLLALLQQTGQTPELIHKFWNPLCLAVMNTPLAESSAELFVNVLRDAFLQQRGDSDLLYAKHDLGTLFNEPAMQYIEQQGGEVRLGQRVTRLLIEDQQIKGVGTAAGELHANQVILAVPPYALSALSRTQPALASLRQQCDAFTYEPICTVYLHYPPTVKLPQPMLGLLGGLGQWVFDRGVYDQPGLLAVVLSSRGDHLQLENPQLIVRLAQELATLFPDWPAHEQAYVLREKRATFASRVGINAQRPDHRTAIRGLWLAGDYTRTGYPATLEGAVRSGVQCATLAHQALQNPEQDTSP
ncbi:hydroxysqualene dehydroxylase HpnE [Thiohalophilus sp.]|uniref:hydroxysqualene dehydroxylase HpnE n=1 Tax=Thiohalophilus sp. TaxID=3028392 RepID=UPI002ACED3F0|nr:hydroxysqualene dehydroxylase HpnE [Thiohalophilus sp.]MDZ7662749.1 hydroxysqualene dehydroxylase HpnE [Thiohalophilus sp.]